MDELAIVRLMNVTLAMAMWLEDAEPSCDAGNPDGGGVYTCEHCIVARMTTEAYAALKPFEETYADGIPAAATSSSADDAGGGEGRS